MERSRLHFQQWLLLLFDVKKSVAEAQQTFLEAYGDATQSYSSCQFRFKRFKSVDFVVNDNDRSEGRKKFENELQALIDKKPAETLKKVHCF